MIQFSVLLLRISISFHLSPLLRSVSITVGLWAVGSIRPTFPLISIFGQKLYTRCLFSWSSPGRRLLYYFPVFRTQFFITSSPYISYINYEGGWCLACIAGLWTGLFPLMEMKVETNLLILRTTEDSLPFNNWSSGWLNVKEQPSLWSVFSPLLSSNFTTLFCLHITSTTLQT